MHEGRSEQALSDQPGTARPARPCVLLVEGDLEVQREPSAAVLDWPPDAGPAAGCELALPGHALRNERVLVAGPATVAQRGELADEVIGHPVGHFLTELVLGRGLGRVHGP